MSRNIFGNGAPGGSFRRSRRSARAARQSSRRPAAPADETILGNPRNRPETKEGYTFPENKAAANTPGGSYEPLNALGGSCHAPENRGFGLGGRHRRSRIGDLSAHHLLLQPDRARAQGGQADDGDELGYVTGSLGHRKMIRG